MRHPTPHMLALPSPGKMRVVLVVLAVLWSALALGFWKLAGMGSAAVVAVTRWLDLAPSSTQWLADLLGLAGGLLQLVVAGVWGLGLLALALLGKMGMQAAKMGEMAANHPYFSQNQTDFNDDTVVEGEKIDTPPTFISHDPK